MLRGQLSRAAQETQQDDDFSFPATGYHAHSFTFAV